MSEPRLELLIRGPGQDDGGFTIKEVPSGIVYAGYRPTRLPEGGYETAEEVSPLDGRRHYVLKANGSAKYLSLNDREHYLWSLMDGAMSISDIASAYFFQFGSLDLAAIKTLLGRLREAGLVEFVPASRLRVAVARSKNPVLRLVKKVNDRLEFRIEDADGFVTRLYDRGGRLLVGRYMMVLYVLLSLLGVTAYGRAESLAKFPWELFFRHPYMVTGAVLLSFYPIAAVHELFHALACKRFGREVHAFGFTFWDGFYPSFYTDVSDIYLSPRRQRLAVSLAGPISTTALASVFLLPVYLFPSSSWADSLYQMGVLVLFVGFVSLYPFQLIKMDGYYILVDLLGFPGLRERTFAFLGNLPAFLRSGRRFTRTEYIMLAYFKLSVLSITGLAWYVFR